MLLVAWSQLVKRTSRLLLSLVAVALGVGFVAGTFVVTDTMREAMLDSLTRSPGDLDVIVERPATAVAGGVRTVPATLLEQVRRVPGVSAVNGELWGAATVTAGGRELVSPDGRPAVVLGIAEAPQLRAVTLLEGRMPEGSDDVVVDRDTARRTGLDLGERLTVTGEGERGGHFTVVGVVDLGSSRARFGDAVVIGLLTPVAADVLAATGYGRIEVLAEPGVSQVELQRRVGDVVGSQYAVRTGDEVRQREAEEAAGALRTLSNVLLVFAGVSLLVSGFVVFNTFAVSVARRLRETALLRCVGATRRQVFAGTIAEAALLGAAASLVGLAFGVGVAFALLTMFGRTGDSLDTSTTPLQLQPRTALVGLAAGVLVAVAAALVPTVRASRTAPVEALRRQHQRPRATSRRRRIAVVALGAGGVGLTGYGVVVAQAAGGGTHALVGAAAGALLILVSVIVAGPLYMPRVAVRAGGALARLVGHPARLAGEVARHNAHRTAVTAAALTIGLTLVALVSTMAAATTASMRQRFEASFPFAYSISGRDSGEGVPGEVAAALASRAEVAGVVGIRGPDRSTEATVDGQVVRVRGVDDAVAVLAPGAAVEGSLSDFGPGTAALGSALAEDLAVRPGDTISVAFAEEERLELRVVALLDAASPFGPVALSATDLARVAPDLPVSTLLVQQGSEAGDDALRRAVEEELAGYASLRATSARERVEQWSEAIDELRTLLLVLLGLSVLIAFFSLANTLSLSVLERVRESALLRALGLTRRQLRQMLAAESVIVSLAGAGTGILLGVLLGWVLAAANGNTVETVFVLPVGQLVAFAVSAVVVGLLASVFPARRALRAPIVASLADE